MSEQQEKEESVDTISPGQSLKRAREQAGLTLNDLSQMLKIKASELDGIENDKLDKNKSILFTKGYVKSYAKLVGLDVESIVDEFNQFHNQHQEKATLQSFSKRVEKEANDERWMMVTYVILLVFIGGIVWWWLQQPDSTVATNTSIPPVAETTKAQNDGSSERTPRLNQRVSNEQVSNDSVATLPIIETAVATQTATSDASSVNSNQDGGGISSPQITNLNDQTIDTQTTDTLNVDNQGSTSDTQDTQDTLVPVVFIFAEDCWVNIVDGTGEAIAFGVKKAGRVMEIEGLPPFEVTLGAPQVVSIEYDGEAVDMSSFTGGQTARLILPRQG